jgi:hypothetical protein
MRLSLKSTRFWAEARMRILRDSERGFTMIAALAVMVVSSALVTAAFVAADSDIGLTQHDLYAKRAYYAARAGVNQFVHNLNQDPTYWQTCPNQPTTAVPGATDGETYSFRSLGANGQTCDATNPIPTMIDTETGTFSIQFTGEAGTPTATRSLVASFRRPSPLDFLWYSVYETLDPSVYRPPLSNPNACAGFYDQNRTPARDLQNCVDIDWVTADVMNGPMFTQDEYQICGRPTFGRPGHNDKIEAAGNPPTHGAGGGCNGSTPTVHGTLLGGQPIVPLPTVNSRLRVDALAATTTIFGGETTIDLKGNQMTIQAVEQSPDGVNWVPSPPMTVPLDQFPIIYVDNLPGCTNSYTPFGVSYPSGQPSGPCGTVYVNGNYTQPLTIATASDIVVNGDITTATDGSGNLTGAGILGLVANNFIRVMHSCAQNIRLGDPTVIDAAVLALNHSFIVDDYNCDSPLGSLVVNGAIAQRFRGTVGTHNGQTISTGYAKDYTYDDRLKLQQPPYMFDIQNQSWKLFRETLCISGSDC